MSSTPFKYRPLDQTQPSIRLLSVLRKRSRDGLLECQMIPSTMSAKYTCLSYVWGTENDHGGPFDILVDGERFAVRYNLYTFLEVARIKYFKKLLWIDALCIDQANVKERNKQVQQMGDIYSKAEMVIAWLG
ncbi:HET-domain-containing protein, partial [Ophiobolus disseminans]